MNALFNSLATAAPAPSTFWMPRAESTTASNVDFMFMAITYLSYFFFALIVGLMILFVVRYRQRGTDVVHHENVAEHNTPLEVTWTVVPVILVVIIFFAGFKGYLALITPPANAYQIDVVAKQWSWSFKYPSGATSTDLVVPVGRPIKLVMRSDDVLHCLFIPDFRVKQDVVPARYSTLWFQALTATTLDDKDEPANFHLFNCTEYCGKDHSRMNGRVIVLEEGAFKTWEEKLKVWIEVIPEAERYYKAGPKLYARCASCHTLDGTAGTGPSWGPHTGLPAIWERTEKGLTKVDGKPLSELIGPSKEFAVPEDYLRNSILNPNKHVVDGFAAGGMPTFQGQLNDVAIDALIGFMKRLNEFDSKGVWKNPDGQAPK